MFQAGFLHFFIFPLQATKIWAWIWRHTRNRVSGAAHNTICWLFPAISPLRIPSVLAPQGIWHPVHGPHQDVGGARLIGFRALWGRQWLSCTSRLFPRYLIASNPLKSGRNRPNRHFRAKYPFWDGFFSSTLAFLCAGIKRTINRRGGRQTASFGLGSGFARIKLNSTGEKSVKRYIAGGKYDFLAKWPFWAWFYSATPSLT